MLRRNKILKKSVHPYLEREYVTIGKHFETYHQE